MEKQQRLKLDELKEIVVLNESDIDKDFFTGFTTKVKTDIKGVAHEFLDEQDTYYKVTDIFDGIMYMREGRVIDILMSIPKDEYENGDNDVLIVEGDKMLWLSNETALDLATWILDNVWEVDK